MEKILSQGDIPYNFIKISDHLYCLGVQLFSNYSTTRQVNGANLVDKVSNIINPWRSGRFMALLDRAHAINSKVL